ncbi:MAG: pyruvate kinase [Bacteroidetes bacterium HGW-Bacteroidetes-22]|nr:MAG: pyruvate kinase [Bacteroidetes bacterium HGW-Bacteroidetes-22]
MFLNEGEEINISCHKKISDESGIYINHPNLPSEAKIGEAILINDGKLKLRITSIYPNEGLKAMVEIGGILSSRKGVNLPDTCLNVKSMTDKDHKDLAFILQHQFEWLALSFVRTADDISELRKEIAKITKKQSPAIIAKIEKPEAVKNFDSILRVCDGIMIARGDLGVEVPFELLPVIQKSIIHKTIPTAKPVIVATQMLEGMMINTTPSRAEINDVANSVMDGADALMLSGETATGLHPIESVETMQRVINRIELSGEVNQNRRDALPGTTERFITDTLIQNATQLATETSAKAITAYTHTGYTAFRLAAHRPKARIFIFTDNPWLPSRLKLLWGVEALFLPKPSKTVDYTEMMRQALTRNRWLDKGDVVIHLASFPLSAKGKTNMLYLASV